MYKHPLIRVSWEQIYVNINEVILLQNHKNERLLYFVLMLGDSLKTIQKKFHGETKEMWGFYLILDELAMSYTTPNYLC